MKRTALAITIASVITGSAAAADYPVRGAVRVGCPAAAFEGAYIGANGGGAWWSTNRTDQDAVVGEVTTYNQKTAAGIVGGQLGYNWARCNTLIGVEVDGDWSSAERTTQLIPNTPGVDVHLRSRFDAIWTARVRVGLAADNLLVYLTAGAAGAHFNTDWVNFTFAPPPVLLLQANISEVRWGFVGGFGTEWALSDRVSLRSEVLYADFTDREHSLLVAGFGPADFTHGDSMWLARVGLNLRLGPTLAGH